MGELLLTRFVWMLYNTCHMITTINISLPKSMYEDAQAMVERRGYSSMSEFIRDVLRKRLYPQLTENGFTPSFEEEVMRSASEPIKNSVEWDGKGSFVDFVLKHPAKKQYGTRAIHRKVQKKSSGTSYRDADDQAYGGRAYPTL